MMLPEDHRAVQEAVSAHLPVLAAQDRGRTVRQRRAGGDTDGLPIGER